MELRVYYDERVLWHDNGPGHPERAERVSAALRRIRQTDYGIAVSEIRPHPVEREALERVHTAAYVSEVAASQERDRTVFDADTTANRHSFDAARLAAGAAVDAARAAVAGDQCRSFVLMRPPGHHAEADRAMGFCLFNNVAVAAADTLNAGLDRVAIVDWDVHHGNGTEHIFAERDDVLYVSLHQYPHYPGTGRSRDVGAGEGAGYTVNVPLPAGSGEEEYRAALDRLVIPIVRQYAPDLILVSAGFDAHERDPLAGMLLTPGAFYRMTGRLVELAEEVSQGRIVHLLEGGYDLTALADGVDAVLRGLAGMDYATGEAAAGHMTAGEAAISPAAGGPSRSADDGFPGESAARIAESALAESAAALRPYWRLDDVT